MPTLVSVSLAMCSGALPLIPAAHAQGLARPGWAGFGAVPVEWWRTAVFYRVDPARFQASGSASTGDLQGLAQRLPYIRSLGVDALVLDGDFNPDDLDQLLRAAAGDQLRVLLTVTPQMQLGDRQQLLAQVHTWLGMGVAGFYLAPDPTPGASEAGSASLAADLWSLLHSLPGDRVLLSGNSIPRASRPTGAHGRRAGTTGLFSTGQDGQLILGAELPTAPSSGEAAALRESLTALASADAGSGVPFVIFAHAPQTGSPNAAAYAAALLASRGDALLDFGDEIGLDTASATSGSGTRALLPVMQWTPANVQQAAAPIERPPSTPGVTAFGPYRPYVHPPPALLTGAAPTLPGASVNAALPPDLPPPDTLPGFTQGMLPVPPIEGARINVAIEERDPQSLLNDYRQLISLHHGNLALQSGAQVVLNRDAQHAVVWVRRAAGGQHGQNVIVAANLGDQAVTLSLDDDLARLGMHMGSLRPLWTASPTPLTAEQTGALMLPPHAVFLGELRKR